MGIAIHWFRRDLRLDDNAALFHALLSGNQVLCLFIFDKNILDQLHPLDTRVRFIHEELNALKEKLINLGSDLLVHYGSPLDIWKEILSNYSVKSVYTNRDYEPYAIKRDEALKELLKANDVPFFTFKDHVIFEYDEVLKSDGKPYTVFTPYSKKWKEKLSSKSVNGSSFYLQSYPNHKYFNAFGKIKTADIPELSYLGFKSSDIEIPSRNITNAILKKYKDLRDFPGLSGTSRLGVHLRFGTISIREIARKATVWSETYLNELIWRDFYSQILAHFPQVVTQSFKKQYDHIEWRKNEKEYEAWCSGTTGYPIVDAGMRELNATGYMNNRVRMITASFFTKHLLMDWRLGEAYFAEKLLDYELASNNGGWQWASGSGTDAAPYFRIFNPTAQQEKFDKELIYIKNWVPEYGTSDYPSPIVDHKFARERCLDTYKNAFNNQ